MDPIVALQNYLSGLSADKKSEFVSKTGFDLDNLYLMNYETAKKYCEALGLECKSTNNIWTKYYQAKAEWNAYHEMYTQANSQYKILKAAKETAKKEYDEKVAKAIEQNEGNNLTTSQDLAIRRETKYTTDTIKSAQDAEFTANQLLDKCFMAVNNQRQGLNEGILGEMFGGKI